MSIADVEVVFDHGKGYGSSEAKRDLLQLEYPPHVGDLLRVDREWRVVDAVRHDPLGFNGPSPRVSVEVYGESDYEYAPEETKRLLERHDLVPDSDIAEEMDS